MKLDPTDLRYLSGDVYRVLTAVEMGSKNHEVVPVVLIAQISGLRTGGVQKCIGELAKRNLIARVIGIKYDGYRLTYGGYDFLAMRTFAKRDSFYAVGNQIGTGKESDIYVVATEEGEQHCLKIHRLGRISFRSIKSKRDYLRKGQSASWMYMSRLSAMKEYAFMKILHEYGFPVPRPIDQARHCLVMELIDAFPLRQISEIANPGALYSDLMDLIVRLARSGLIHGDFNEFNILVREPKEGEDEETNPVVPILIDFPQMVSTDHENAEFYFNRDVQCIRTFFKKRFRYESSVYPRFSGVIKDGKKDFELDVMVAASGFGKKEGEALENYMKMVQEADARGDQSGEGSEDDVDEEDEEGDEVAEDDPHAEGAEENAESGEGDPVASTSSAESADSDLAEDVEKAKLDDEEEEEEEEEEESDDAEEGEDEADRRRRKRAQKPRPPRVTEPKDVRAIVTNTMDKQHKNSERRHHGKRGITAGRSKGSKIKSDPRNGIRDSLQF